MNPLHKLIEIDFSDERDQSKYKSFVRYIICLTLSNNCYKNNITVKLYIEPFSEIKVKVMMILEIKGCKTRKVN